MLLGIFLLSQVQLPQKDFSIKLILFPPTLIISKNKSKFDTWGLW